MNSLLSKYALQAAAFVFLLQSSNSTPVIVELKRSDGSTIVGIEEDKQHFMDCHEVQIDILPSDKIVKTDKTCKGENPDQHCRFCAYHPSFPGADNKYPAGASDQVDKNQPAAMGASKPNSEAQNASKIDEQNEQKTPTASAGVSDSAGAAKSKTASKKKATKKAESNDKHPPI